MAWVLYTWVICEKKHKDVKEMHATAVAKGISSILSKISERKGKRIGFRDWLPEKKDDRYIAIPARTAADLAKITTFFYMLKGIVHAKYGVDIPIEKIIPDSIIIKEDPYSLRSDRKLLEKKLREKNMTPLTAEDVVNNPEILKEIAINIFKYDPRMIPFAEEVAKDIQKYIPHIKNILNALPDDPNFYKEIGETPIRMRNTQVQNKLPHLVAAADEFLEELLKDAKSESASTLQLPAPSPSSPHPQELPSEHIPEPLAGVFKALGDKIKPDEVTVLELRLTLAGEMTLEELSKRWERYGFSLLDLLKKEGALKNAFREAIEEFRKAGFGVLPVPREVLPLIENPELETVTAARLFYSALESVAVRGLPERGEEIIELVTGILERVPAFSPYVEEIPKELERSAETLAKTLALMKDGSYLETLEAELAPLLEKVPETRKVGLFKRDSPRRKVEDFAALLMEGNLDEDEAERKAGELKEYLKSHLASEEVEKLVAGLMFPFRARKLLEKHGTAEGFLFEYAHSMASRMLHLEGLLAVGSKPGRDELARLFAFLPGTEGTVEVPLEKLRDNLRLLGF